MAREIPDENIKLKRAYDAAADADGYRVLVDRLWPRGIRKQAAQLDRWMRNIAPSAPLRRWFAHDVARWNEFQVRYREELATQDTELQQLRDVARRGPLTLVYSAHDTAHNDAVVLRDVLLRRAGATHGDNAKSQPQRRQGVRKVADRSRETLHG